MKSKFATTEVSMSDYAHIVKMEEHEVIFFTSVKRDKKEINELIGALVELKNMSK